VLEDFFRVLIAISLEEFFRQSVELQVDCPHAGNKRVGRRDSGIAELLLDYFDNGCEWCFCHLLTLTRREIGVFKPTILSFGVLPSGKGQGSGGPRVAFATRGRFPTPGKGGVQ